MKKEMTLHEKAIRLCEGGIVECSGHALKAVVIPIEWDSCNECSMDSACNEEIKALCEECDTLQGLQHLLKFAHN